MTTSPAHFLNMLKFSTGLDALSLTSKYSSVVRRVARMPYAGPGTAAWQRKMYGHPFTDPDKVKIENRAKLYLPRNASIKDVLAAYDAPGENRSFAGLLGALGGAGALGVAGISAYNHLGSPETVALLDGNPAHLDGFNFVPDR